MKIEFTRIDNDFNGNPRYVVHYLDLLRPDESGYGQALVNGRKLGGRKFHNKQYGGGIVFQSYNIHRLEEQIKELNGSGIVYHRGPNAYELKIGHGATHYRTFDRELVTNRAGNLKKWFKCKDDGLNYSL